MDETRQIQWFRRELAQTSQQFEEKVRELLAVRRVWDSLKFTRDSRKVFEAVLDIIVDETSATCASLLLVNLKNGQLTLRTTRGRVPEGTLSHLLMDERIAEAVANSRKPTSIPDLSATRPSGPSGTLFCVPLLIDDQVVGVIHLYHSDPHAFSEDDERVMTVIADQVAVALNSAQIFDEMQQFNALLEAEVAKATEELRRTNADLEGQITERLRAEAALRERERQLEELNASLEERVRLRTLELQVLYERIDGLVRHLPEGVFLLDEDLRLIVANPAARAFLAELGSAEVGQVISEIGGQRLETLLEPRKGDLPYELTMEAPSGKRIFEIRARSISEGRIGGGWVVVLREVTREREALERMRQQDRLATVGQLAAGIAHDFNNLLMGIIGLAELLEMRPDIPESARGNLARIVTQGERGAQLIRQILDFSRKSFVEQQAIDLVPFIQEAV
ncbi:MAG: GAF domain-containing protein, partial [Planctomycetota bacterium]